ncbi:phosphoribosyl-AMP cyclohydrolase [Acinetobacter gyllenbergii]|uniref:phosphoribosyl-AMP cyclohydrolase n=1 Tax=Acinetobacter gyllenbergii TaxID=134534 RepID=UPI0008068674|nr:phosphoribosyl-AMP cyclohydrolase [Acinetobacter gyllenbergii]OBY75144.1 phosphoribosyl-AMP cyclohydrolase [Acinetobacter gyllenbergii]
MVEQTIFEQMEYAVLGQQFAFDSVFEQIKWNQDGLIPVITQAQQSKAVLMMAWVNREALLETLITRQVCYWSRSRQCLWRKGESSGHRQYLTEARLDCDGDSLLLVVNQIGPACHTQRPDCFYLGITTDQVTILTEPML